LNLLADGGGIRGLSAIQILKAIMDRVNEGRPELLHPWQVFDLMGGTSTGGCVNFMIMSRQVEAYIRQS